MHSRLTLSQPSKKAYAARTARAYRHRPFPLLKRSFICGETLRNPRALCVLLKSETTQSPTLSQSSPTSFSPDRQTSTRSARDNGTKTRITHQTYGARRRTFESGEVHRISPLSSLRRHLVRRIQTGNNVFSQSGTHALTRNKTRILIIDESSNIKNSRTAPSHTSRSFPP